MAATSHHNSQAHELHAAHSILPPAKRRKTTEVEQLEHVDEDEDEDEDWDEDEDEDEQMYDIEVKLYSDAKAAKHDPKSLDYRRQRAQELLAFYQSQGDGDNGAGTAPDNDDSGGATVECETQGELTQPRDIEALPTANESTQHPDYSSEGDSDDCSEDTSESYRYEDEYDDEDFDNEAEDEDFEDCVVWDWLEAINSFAYPRQLEPSPELRPGRTQAAGSCSSKLIRRDCIRPIFHHEIDEPSEETSQMGFELFDRYGRLKPEFKDHPFKKGSGIWGDELSYGDILLLEDIQVQESHRRRGLGGKLVRAILEKTKKKTESFVAIAQPAALTREIESQLPDSADQDQRATIIEHNERIATLFWRSLGFRRIGSSAWFALADPRSPGHPCYSLAATDDYDRPAAAPRTTFPEVELLFESLSLESLDDATCLKMLRETLQEYPSGEPHWVATDEAGNTLLHIAALNGKHECAKWIMERCQLLTQLRNHEGDTPLEAFSSHLEHVRTQVDGVSRVMPASDKFSGFSDAMVACSAVLRGQTDMQQAELLRLKYGCSCGGCISGFLSPRMQLALRREAEIQYDEMLDFGSIDNGVGFVGFYADLLVYLPHSVRENLKTNKSMRQGFASIWRHTATCLGKQVVPTESNVLHAIRQTSEWPPVTKNYLQGGGTVKAVASMLFQKAMSHDAWAGDGPFSDDFGDQIKELPQCRNDHEFGFVSRMCGYKRICQIRYISVLTGEEIDSDRD